MLSTPTHRLAATSLLLAFLTPTLAHAQSRDISRKYEKNEKYGYAINLPEDWQTALLGPDEEHLVGKFAPDSEEARMRGDFGSFGAKLSIARMVHKTPTTGREAVEKEKEDEEKRRQEELVRRLRGKMRDPNSARTIDEYLDFRFDAANRYRPETIRVGRGRKAMTGELREFTSRTSFVYCGVFTSHGFDWAVVYQCPENYANDWKECFEKSMKTFRVFEGEVSAADATAESSDLDLEGLSKEEKRERIAASIEGQSGWWAHETENYVFLSNSENKRLIRDLGKEVETLRAKVYEELFPPTDEITAIGTVRVFNDAGQYHAYGGPPGSAGYWSSQHEELVLFDGFQNVSSGKSIEQTKSVMYHEAFHQYIYYAVGDLAPHSWFNEGHGDYFAGHLIRGRRAKAQPFEWRIEFLRRHLAMGRSLIPIRSLVRLPQREYYSNAGLKYAQGWALVYFLREVARKKEWRQIPDRYFAHLRDNVAEFKRKKDEEDDDAPSLPAIPGLEFMDFEDQEKLEKILEEAVDKGFEGVDYEELDAAFQQWVESIV